MSSAVQVPPPISTTTPAGTCSARGASKPARRPARRAASRTLPVNFPERRLIKSPFTTDHQVSIRQRIVKAHSFQDPGRAGSQRATGKERQSESEAARGARAGLLDQVTFPALPGYCGGVFPGPVRAARTEPASLPFAERIPAHLQHP